MPAVKKKRKKKSKIYFGTPVHDAIVAYNRSEDYTFRHKIYTVTAKDRQDWKIPPCISQWKNACGYTIPLDKRLLADGRQLQVRFNNKI